MTDQLTITLLEDRAKAERARLVALHDALCAAGLAFEDTTDVTIQIPATGQATVTTTTWVSAGETQSVTRPLTHKLTFTEESAA
jgi:hypothetical protein